MVVRQGEQRLQIGYDRVVLALGSQLRRPSIAALSFDVDTFWSARRLATHMDGLRECPPSPSRNTVAVVGAGLTGIEVATALPARLNRAFGGQQWQIILIDQAPVVGSDMGEHARPIIEEALATAGIKTRLGQSVQRLDRFGLALSSGEEIPAATVIWCAGLQANPATLLLAGQHDHLGRIWVDALLQVRDAPAMFAAGDVAAVLVDPEHCSVMSCQYARPMGRIAGHNVVADLYGRPMLGLATAPYVTILDLGAWGAIYTAGWDRRVRAAGADAKRTKIAINCQRIYPPRNGSRVDILAAAAPV